MNLKKFICGCLCVLLLAACSGDLAVKQDYEFSLSAMPVQKKIVKGEVAEIRLLLHRQGRYEQASYTIRMFQTEGKGCLRLEDGTILLANDRYALPSESFRLFYTSESTEQQTIEVFVEDGSGRLSSLSFAFNNENKEKEV